MKAPDSKLTFLGTGGGRVSVSNQIRASGGFILQLPDLQIHVDPGPGALTCTGDKKVYANKTTTIICTHAHIDHANDINALIEAITLGGIHKKGVLISTKEVIDGSAKEIPWLRKGYREYLQQTIVVGQEDTIKLGDYTLTTTKTNHDVSDCFGFRLDGPDISLGYTSDTAYFKELRTHFKDVAVLVINVLRPDNDKWKTHMCTADAIKLIDEIRPELAVITHFGAKIIRAGPLQQAREIQKKTGIRTIAAHDGLDINLEGLAQRRGVQTTL
jgi:ribonuclease BN (tRNA processing enzyme)